jgi:hypothetical protein
MYEEFEPLKNETATQRQFREDMEEAGIEIRTYSGRGMYGRYTYGVSCGRGDGPSEQEVYRATEIKLCQDALGLGTILYV